MIAVSGLGREQHPSKSEESHAGAGRLAVSSWPGPSYARPQRQASHLEKKCLLGLAVVNASQTQEEMGEDQMHSSERSGRRVCVTQARVMVPFFRISQTVTRYGTDIHTLEGGSETGSYAKLAMRRAWHRDCCKDLDRLRSSCSASGDRGSSRFSPAPVSAVTWSTAACGSISS